MIDYTKISNNLEVIKLLKQRREIELKIQTLDDEALLKYELEILSEKIIKD